MKRAVVSLLAVVTIPATAFFVGVNAGADSLRAKHAAAASEIEAVEPGPLKQQVIEREVIKIKTEKVITYPQSCLEASLLAVEVLAEVDKISQYTGKLQLVADHLAKAIVLDDVRELNTAKGQIRSYRADIIGSQIALTDMRRSLDLANDSCTTELGEQAL